MLKIYNSLGRKIEEFKPIKEGEVGLYVCGPTVYGPDHLGHARTYIFFDWLRRYFLMHDYKVKFIQNITDVGHLMGDAEEGEDKIEKEAKEERKSPDEIARYWENEHFADMKALDVLTPTESPRATEHINDITDFINVLIEKGFAYEKGGNVYFSVDKIPDYGKLSGRNLDEEKQGTRVEVDKKKKNPADFVLWLKADDTHLQKWPSPWGEGYPGWHIECSVMSRKYLGQPFDLHGAANEHIFPHHENEIAQSEAYAGKPLANFWVHSGMLTVGDQKMSKSKYNYITIKDVLKEVDADTIKIAFMNTAWKKPFDWSKSAIFEAQKVRERLVRAKEKAQTLKTGIPLLIDEALENDFNVPQALAVIMENISKLSQDDFKYIEEIFGLELEDKIELSKKQEEMMQQRENARKSGDYGLADELRKKLYKEGIIVEDTASGSRISLRG